VLFLHSTEIYHVALLVNIFSILLVSDLQAADEVDIKSVGQQTYISCTEELTCSASVTSDLNSCAATWRTNKPFDNLGLARIPGDGLWRVAITVGTVDDDMDCSFPSCSPSYGSHLLHGLPEVAAPDALQ